MIKTAIICVDDQEIILTSLEEQLKRNISKDYDIELATSAQEALLLCAELEAEGISIALVISDQTMPEMSGDEFLIKLHASYPKTLKILLTGQAEADSVGNIVNAAALYRYIAKPWDETDLILTVKEALRRYGQEQQLVQQNILLKQTNQKLRKSLNLLLATLEATDDGILVLDNQGKIIIFNQQFAKIWELNSYIGENNSDEVFTRVFQQLVAPYTCDLTKQNFQSHPQKHELLQLNNGKILECYSQTQRLEQEIVGFVWGFRDVTEREQSQAIALKKTFYDTLTELPKRSILTCQLSEAITKAQQNSDRLAVMFVDLDRFKVINDTLGHTAGDRLIQKVVHRLKDCVREKELIARWGGDEFTLLLPKINSQKYPEAIATKILETLKPPFYLEDKQIHLTTSIGIAIYPEHGTNVETLMKNADAALSQAKQQGRNNYQYYDPTINSQVNNLLKIENLLHSALKQEELLLFYQPIVNVMTGKIVKMEALLRWQNPQLGFVSPQIFIPLAEENGTIVPIGEWVLQTACAQNKLWQEMGLLAIKISVNLSVRQFQQPNLVTTIINILEQTQLSPFYLELEITESVTMRDVELAKTILTELNKIEITLSMDDFGTGYSSLGYLKQFPFHTLKIDRSFIKDLTTSSQDLAIVNAIIALGKGLNLTVVAEGVETEEIKNLLKNIGCEYIQGYLFSKPLPAAEATKLLENHHLI
ncbi:response regulator receiver modulated diguanylate cyclase/phosphodiesterase with PAS/PAC sensor(s) [Stanieria cyanosphaera PCC 7437]|uniref:Response regulator receiver modulated diguanylate cyclase/phosphodiesterase with PAS/PAC sensor(S) n=1 Tax=Stanieria cyanosphaera (strain ATCC 29371 / PCC 7437) TaxID=111780 RepID=K9Y1A1_STAC7|nr:EAL domain-containing protein [Stanieria cyanosphaera]AFZ37747.1 response regulator receiver modulated diguanylate cyclase/phosphodiesterase with PAS/PAC sensor(s) [Stanieria cyanosphaera PCC 7437]